MQKKKFSQHRNIQKVNIIHFNLKFMHLKTKVCFLSCIFALLKYFDLFLLYILIAEQS
jgi:hypothetical protein